MDSSCSGLYGDVYACVLPVSNYPFSNANTILADWNAIDGNVLIQSGKIILKPVGDGAKAYVDVEYHNFITEVSIILLQANSKAGFIICGSSFSKGVNNYRGYYAGIEGRDGSHIVLGIIDNGWCGLADQRVEIKPGQEYRLVVEAYGDNIKVSLQMRANVLINVNDSTFHSGNMGLRAEQVSASISTVNIKSMYVDMFSSNLVGWTITDGGFDARNSWVVAPKTDSGKAMFNSVFANMMLDTQMFEISDEGNAGFILPANDLSAGPDAYRGYYVGFTTSSVVLGRADYSWKQLSLQSATIANS